MFFWVFFKILKILHEFLKHNKTERIFFVFLDNSIRVACGKFPVFLAENLSTVISVLTNNPKILDLTKREVFQLDLPQSDERKE